MIISLHGSTFRLAIHTEDGEITEVYAFLQSISQYKTSEIEILRTEDLNSMFYELNKFIWAYADTPNYKPSEISHV